MSHAGVSEWIVCKQTPAATHLIVHGTQKQTYEKITLVAFCAVLCIHILPLNQQPVGAGLEFKCMRAVRHQLVSQLEIRPSQIDEC